MTKPPYIFTNSKEYYCLHLPDLLLKPSETTTTTRPSLVIFDSKTTASAYKQQVIPFTNNIAFDIQYEKDHVMIMLKKSNNIHKSNHLKLTEFELKDDQTILDNIDYTKLNLTFFVLQDIQMYFNIFTLQGVYIDVDYENFADNYNFQICNYLDKMYDIYLP